MLTRGYFIGQIIDELTAISHQVEARAGLQLLDLNIFLENFYRDVLNIVYDLKLDNLNDERSNNPGLDLGDEANGVAYQITSNKLTAKVNETLEAVCKDKSQIEKYPTIFVFIVRPKQGKYTINKKFDNQINFKSENVVDVNDLLKDVLALQIEPLKALYDLVVREVARVKIELEIPDRNGKFNTNIDKFIEAIPKEQFEGVATYLSYVKSVSKSRITKDLTEEDVEQDFKDFIKRLKKLPRITRQVYSFLLSRGEWNNYQRYMNADVFDRICSFPDKQGEMRILSEYGFVIHRPIEEYGEQPIFQIETVRDSLSENFTAHLLRFIKKNSIGLDKVVVSLNFSDFK
jgi:hypothetical protein